jgi:hypothetical protein
LDFPLAVAVAGISKFMVLPAGENPIASELQFSRSALKENSEDEEAGSCA